MKIVYAYVISKIRTRYSQIVTSILTLILIVIKIYFRSDPLRMGDNLGGGRRHHTNSISKQLNTITDMNVLETSKHLDPLGIFPGGDRTDMESQVK